MFPLLIIEAIEIRIMCKINIAQNEPFQFRSIPCPVSMAADNVCHRRGPGLASPAGRAALPRRTSGACPARTSTGPCLRLHSGCPVKQSTCQYCHHLQQQGRLSIISLVIGFGCRVSCHEFIRFFQTT